MSGVGITGLIEPLNGASFPVWADVNGFGGWRSVADMAARDALPANFRKVGMVVAVQDTDSQFILVGGITNGDYQPLSFATNAPLSDVLYVDGGSTVGAPNGSSSAPYKTVTDAIAAAAAAAVATWAFIITPGSYSGEAPINLPSNKNLIFWGLGSDVSGFAAVTDLPDMVVPNAMALSFRNCNVGSLTHPTPTGGATIDLQYCNCNSIQGSSAGGTSVYAIGIPNSPIGNLSNFSAIATMSLTGCLYFGFGFTATTVNNIVFTNCQVFANAGVTGIGSSPQLRAWSTTFGVMAFTGFADVVLDADSMVSFQANATAAGASINNSSLPLVFSITPGASVTADYGAHGIYQSLALATASTIAVVRGPLGWSYLFLTQTSGGSHVPTLTGVVWAGGAPPTFSTANGATDVVSLFNDGTRMLATTGSMLGFI